MPKSKEFVESDSDNSSDSEQDKKSKKKKRASEDDKGASSKKPKKETQREEPEETEWDLGNNRRVTVREFKERHFVDIREMYMDKSGDMKPGKKGISLSLVQWRKFMEVVEDVDKVAKSKC